MSVTSIKQSSRQESFKPAIEHACFMWNRSTMSINQAVKLAAKQYKVDADKLAKYVFERVNNNQTQ